MNPKWCPISFSSDSAAPNLISIRSLISKMIQVTTLATVNGSPFCWHFVDRTRYNDTHPAASKADAGSLPWIVSSTTTYLGTTAPSHYLEHVMEFHWSLRHCIANTIFNLGVTGSISWWVYLLIKCQRLGDRRVVEPCLTVGNYSVHKTWSINLKNPELSCAIYWTGHTGSRVNMNTYNIKTSGLYFSLLSSFSIQHHFQRWWIWKSLVAKIILWWMLPSSGI
jgi:hypothetical protein